ncbi:MAG: phenylalanyl-tRNA synthetase alpha chain, partial [Alpinimonas sp.]
MSAPTEITASAVNVAVSEALAAIAAAADSAALKTVRTAHLGEASPLSQLNALMRSVAPEAKAEAGKLMGQAKGRVAAAFAAREEEILVVEQQAQLAAESVDVTAAASRWSAGARHPLMLLQESICDAFVGMG